ncbi:bifunctional 2-keto-4-hydroxyglutarate aldolase/2-keto-3-deoxy-6-phosphogluconate aldolase [Pontibacillus sp. HMF3514]|uniref:bifunctional 2-keto-4-hydroxyglutarate aldolase/2-keto-3-deoxy-6-phosphogluconate aldolase n=1 Tax=Pontibacillus sp. HMF3514 TaxID=2692425 RepID=UPI00131F56D9|nr:bifunctional 2-keto-4-hydroxyglutarate aldolase/2-keto-3-deoxy-6-phosphogluconate aldolase [Pontibacillus sp. HMF3514]QHE53017.1 bifunctional 4-hydroxy-2-oxoglutarate aldolase/2-dehydro-3-deoxy-phosphogluconate aldolase [Pontibacillus sp. HMF3514]
MSKSEILQHIKEQKLIAVIRAKEANQALAYCEEAIKGGLKIIEITMTTPGALELIHTISNKYKDDPRVVIGAGTILDPISARLAMINGAKFIVSPSFNEEVVKLCNLYQVPIIPGVMTVNEAVQALQADCSLVKLFPGDVYGPKMIKSIKGPLPQLDVMPTGGVDILNIANWFKAGAVAVGIGSDLTSEAVETGDISTIQTKAESYVSEVKKIKE